MLSKRVRGLLTSRNLSAKPLEIIESRPDILFAGYACRNRLRRNGITNWSLFVPVAEALPRLVPNSDSRLILLIRHAQVKILVCVSQNVALIAVMLFNCHLGGDGRASGRVAKTSRDYLRGTSVGPNERYWVICSAR